MASEGIKPISRFYTVEELLELVRVNLRYARSLPPGEERDKHRLVARSLRVLFKTRNWHIERPSTAPVRLLDKTESTGASMSYYTAYFVGADGHFAESRDIDVDNDTAAIASVKKMMDGKDIEIWCGLRKVIRLPHKPE